MQKSNAYNYEIKVVPCWNHSYVKQELFSASQSAKLSKYKQVPFCKFSQIYIYIYIIVMENEDGQLRAKENICSKNSKNDKKFNKKRFGL